MESFFDVQSIHVTMQKQNSTEIYKNKIVSLKKTIALVSSF